jgi:hypothetical protein
VERIIQSWHFIESVNTFNRKNYKRIHAKKRKRMQEKSELVEMRKVINIFRFVCALTLLASCNPPKEGGASQSNGSTHERVPDELSTTIEKEFPGALPYSVAIDSLLDHLSRKGITADQILWGQSTCVDDITNTKDKLIHPEIKGPFTFGGLGGLPFTGITGVDAFAHHVPEEGTALLFVGPHIGYSTEGWGKILRHGQHHSSTCCGALVAALNKLQKNEIKADSISEADYQEQVIEQLALRHKDEILAAKDPLVVLTKAVVKEAQQKMIEYARKVRERHFAYAVVVVGVIVNTDYQYDDYLWVESVSIKDIKKDVWIENQMVQ